MIREPPYLERSIIANTIRFCISICFLIVSELLCAQSVAITSEFNRLTLDEEVEYLVENSAPLSLSEVVKSEQWQRWNRGAVNFGFSDKVHWLHFELKNVQKNDLSLIFEIAFPLLQEVDMYVQKSGKWVELKSGSLVHPKDRPVMHSLLLFPIEMAANTSSDIYIRVYSEGLLQMPMAVSSSQNFHNYDHTRSLFFGTIYGFLAIIGLYHCLIYFSVNDKSYLYYGLFSLSLALGFFVLNGSASSYLWPSKPNVSLHGYLVLLQVSILFGMLFVRRVLSLKAIHGTWHKLFGYCAILSVLMIPLSLMVSLQTGTSISLLMASAAVILSTWVIFFRAKGGYAPARYLLFAIVFSGSGIMVSILGSLTLIPSNIFVIHAAYVGLLLGSLLYAFALANRINLEKRERDQAKNELIEMQRTTNEKLDRLVKERTRELEKSNHRLREISETDGLTQVYNRRFFDEAFTKEYRRTKRSRGSISVLLVDVDHFKQVNDNYGHQFGDECLVETAKIMQNCISRPSDIVARYGGEEFVILLPETDREGAINIAENIRESIERNQFYHNGGSVSVTASVGLCTISENSEITEQTFLKMADDCLYRAKQTGRNRVVASNL